MSTFSVWLRDALERAAKAFVAAFVATVVARWAGISDFEAAKQVAIAAVAAGVAAALAAVSALVGNHADGSALPNQPAQAVLADPPQDPALRAELVTKLTNGRGDPD